MLAGTCNRVSSLKDSTKSDLDISETVASASSTPDEEEIAFGGEPSGSTNATSPQAEAEDSSTLALISKLKSIKNAGTSSKGSECQVMDNFIGFEEPTDQKELTRSTREEPSKSKQNVKRKHNGSNSIKDTSASKKKKTKRSYDAVKTNIEMEETKTPVIDNKSDTNSGINSTDDEARGEVTLSADGTPALTVGSGCSSSCATSPATWLEQQLPTVPAVLETADLLFTDDFLSIANEEEVVVGTHLEEESCEDDYYEDENDVNVETHSTASSASTLQQSTWTEQGYQLSINCGTDGDNVEQHPHPVPPRSGSSLSDPSTSSCSSSISRAPSLSYPLSIAADTSEYGNSNQDEDDNDDDDDHDRHSSEDDDFDDDFDDSDDLSDSPATSDYSSATPNNNYVAFGSKGRRSPTEVDIDAIIKKAELEMDKRKREDQAAAAAAVVAAAAAVERRPYKRHKLALQFMVPSPEPTLDPEDQAEADHLRA